MLEIAIEQIRLHLKRIPGNNAILGFYYGEERLLPYSDTSSSKSPLKLPISVTLEEIIRLDLPSSFKAIAINVNPSLLALSGEKEVKNPLECFCLNQATKQWQDHPLATKAKDGNSKVVIPTDYSIIASTIQALSTLQIPTDLHDFDEHLQNPSVVWLYS
ncbi:hypothetical protein DSO57_1036738 [Entomophthora muscae]|uniref:Uncharacterized protein n=1 Tax=Entomophthora muscae TaxID=34485 RepID=A0ACC2U9L0_9FUNG|nr:hypothetical protein DSO57_1036738 [Entomophthora muscae]